MLVNSLSSRRAAVRVFWILAVGAFGAIADRPAAATNYYWDTNGSVAGAGATPVGTWAAGGTTWSTDSTGATATSAYTTQSTDDLDFVAGPGAASGNNAYIVTVSGTQNAAGLFFNASGGTTLGVSAGLGTINLSGDGITISQFAFGSTNSAAVTINSNLALQAAQTWSNLSSNTLTIAGNIDNGANLLTIYGSGADTITGVIGSGGTVTGGLTKYGTGTLTLSAANLYTGTTTLNGGTLTLNAGVNAQVLSSGDNVTFTDSTALTYNNQSASSARAISLGTLTLTGGDAVITSTYGGSSNMSMTFGSLAPRATGATANFVVTTGTNGTSNKIVLGGHATGLISDGTFFNSADYAYYNGSFILAPTYGTTTSFFTTGATTTLPTTGTTANDQITGAVSAQASAQVNTLKINGTFNFTLTGGATFTTSSILLTGGNSTISGGTAIDGNGGELVIHPNAQTLTISTLIQDSTAVTLDGSGTTLLNGATSNTYTGTTYVNSGTLNLFKANGATDGHDNTASAIIGALVIGSGGTVNVQAKNQFGASSTVTVNNGGTLTFSDSTGSSGSYVNPQIIASLTIGAVGNPGGTVNLAGNNSNPTRYSFGSLTMTGGAISGNGSGNEDIQFNGNVTINASTTGSFINNFAGGTGIYNAASDFGSATRTFTVARGTAAVDLYLGDTKNTSFPNYSNGAAIKDGPGIMKIYSGDAPGTDFTGWTLQNGTLILGSGNLVASNTTNTYWTLNNGILKTDAASGAQTENGNLTIANTFNSAGVYGFDTTYGSMTFNGAPTFNDANGSSRTFNVAANTLSFGGALSTPNSLATFIKTGLGKLSFIGGAANANVTANWSVNAGTLSLNGGTTIGSGSITFASGTTIDAQSSTLARTFSNTTVPTAGAFFINNNNQPITFTGAYPSLTGDLALGGLISGSGSTTMSAATTLSSVTGAARVLAVNQLSTSGAANSGTFSLGGITLNADLTVAGGAIDNYLGTTAFGAPASGLGTVSKDSTANTRNLSISMTPLGIVQLNGTSSSGSNLGWNNLTVNSGTVQFNTDGLGTGANTLNGGAIALGAATVTTNLTVNGGALESFGSTQRVYSGALTGTANLVLRVVGTGASQGMGLDMTGNNNTNFAGGFTLAESGTPGSIYFNANSIGSSGNITVPSGVAFGGPAVNTTSYANSARFVTTTNSIYDVANQDLTPNLSSSGFNKDVWVGLTGTPITSYTLPNLASPNDGDNTTYRIVPISGTTLATTNLFGNGTATNLIVSAGAVPTDSNSSATNVLGAGITLTNSNASSYTGTTLITGVVRNALMGGGVGAPTFSTGAGLTGTSVITVDDGASFILSSSANGTTGAAGASIVVKGGGTITVNAANALTTSDTLTLGGSSGGGTYTGNSNSQSLAGVTIAAGLNSLNPAPGPLVLTGSAGSVYTRNVGGIVNFLQATTSFSNAPTGSSTSQGTVGSANSAILIGAVINSGTGLAAASSGTIAAIATYDAGISPSSWGTAGGHDDNIQNNNVNPSGTTPSGATSINSLYVTNNGSVVTIGTLSSDSLSIKSGMMLATGTITFSGPGSLTSGNGKDLIVYATSTVTVNAPISGGLALTKAGSGGTVILANAADALGDIYIEQGTVQVNTSAAALGTSNNIFFSGGGSLLSNVATASYAQNLNVAATGGNLSMNSGQTTTFSGPAAVNGNLSFSVGGGGSAVTNIFSGNITGPGIFGIGRAPNNTGTTASSLVFTGNNPNWSGGIQENTNFGNSASGTWNIRFSPASASNNSAGTGPIAFSSGNGVNSVIFDTSAYSAASTTFANDIINIQSGNNTVLTDWGLNTGLSTTGGTNGVVNLTGRIEGISGLNLQGYATADNSISEMVLSGSIANSGTPGIYSYGTSSVSQNFSAGPGGVVLGVTAFSTLASATSVPLPGNTTATQGALGFVRFGSPSSFLTGDVGPGYIAALHLASDTTNQTGHFGYLVTSTTAGATYNVPEGKSFVIGSLGTDGPFGQIGGTFGVAGGDGSATPYTATLNGSPKAAAGQTLAGCGGGDINIHANFATSNQSLDLLARASNDTLVIGGSNPVVFTPTTGDSGFATYLTPMAKRTGSTTLNKVGAGTLQIADAAFTNTDGTDARPTFSWIVSAGTLTYAQNDLSLSNFAGTTLATGGTLNITGQMNSPAMLNGGTLRSGATGTLSGAVSAGSGANTIAPGGIGSIGTLTLGSTLSLTGTSTLDFDVIGATKDLLAVSASHPLSISGTPNVVISTSGILSGSYTLATFGNTPGLSLSSFNVSGVPTDYALKVDPTDLMLIATNASASWNNNSNSQNYSLSSNWSPSAAPNGAGLVATFDAGNPSGTISASTLTVNVDTANTVGSLVFDPTNTVPTAYTLGDAGGSITLNSNGVSYPHAYNAAGSLVDVQAGSQTINASLVLGDSSQNNTFNVVGANTKLVVSGQGISQTGGTQNLIKTGSGKLEIDAPSSYTGSTRIQNGSLVVGPTGSISTGAVTLDARSSGQPTLAIGGVQSVSSLSTLTDNSGGAATLQLTDVMAGNTVVTAGLLTLNGSSNFQGSTQFQSGTSLNVTAGTLKITATGTQSVGAGVTVTVGAGATLELTGTMSALADPTALSSPGPASNPTYRSEVQNGGLLQIDDGAMQQVGGIDGAGSVAVADNAMLTADHINQTALTIGNGSTFTIAESNMNGDPMAGALAAPSGQSSSGGLVLAGSLTPSSSFVAPSGSLLGVGSSGATLSPSLGGGATGGVAAVPEPASLLLAVLGAVGLFAATMTRRARRSSQMY